MMPRGRGRPPSKATIERRRVEEMLRNHPEHLPLLSAEQKAALKESFDQAERIRQEILRDYKYGKTTPDSHAYSMASLGDESLIGHEKNILEDDIFYEKRAENYRAAGAKATSEKAKVRIDKLKKINQHLIARIRPGSRYSPHSVAQMIQSQWETISPVERHSGEEHLQCRGDGQACPSVSTLRRWIMS
jgi:hypothetical protein